MTQAQIGYPVFPKVSFQNHEVNKNRPAVHIKILVAFPAFFVYHSLRIRSNQSLSKENPFQEILNPLIEKDNVVKVFIEKRGYLKEDIHTV